MVTSNWKEVNKVGRYVVYSIGICFLVFIGWVEYNKYLRQEVILDEIGDIPTKEVTLVRIVQYASSLSSLPTDTPMKCFLVDNTDDIKMLVDLFDSVVRKAPPFPLNSQVKFQLTFTFIDGSETDLLGTIYERVEDDVYFIRNVQQTSHFEIQHPFRIPGKGPWFIQKLTVGTRRSCSLPNKSPSFS